MNTCAWIPRFAVGVHNNWTVATPALVSATILDPNVAIPETPLLPYSRSMVLPPSSKL